MNKLVENILVGLISGFVGFSLAILMLSYIPATKSLMLEIIQGVPCSSTSQ